MPLFARSDLAYLNVPAESGGCGEPHSRPVTQGAPARVWRLDCEPCCDVKRSQNDPHWSSTDAEIPLTYDEDRAREKAEKSGKLDRENQLAAAIIELGKLGQLPEALARALAPALPSVAALAGELVCPSGHAQPAGMKFCGECGAAMHGTVATAALPAAQKAPEPPVPPAGGKPLPRIRDQKAEVLQGLCRTHGVAAEPDARRADLIVALGNAGVTNNDLARYLAEPLVAA